MRNLHGRQTEPPLISWFCLSGLLSLKGIGSLCLITLACTDTPRGHCAGKLPAMSVFHERVKPHVHAFARAHGDARVIRRVFKAFQYRDFRLMWFGACTSSIGTWMQIVAQGWLIYRLSHSAFLLALDQFLGGIPIFLFSLIGGVVADRVERRKILLGFAVRADGQRCNTHHSRRDWSWCTSGIFSVFRFFRFCPGLRRTRVPGVDSDSGRKRRHAQRHRPEFDSVQRGGHGRSRARWPGFGEARREVVLRPERPFVSSRLSFRCP